KKSRRMRHDQFGLAYVEQLDEKTRELHNLVVRPPRMLVLRADGKAGAPIEVSFPIQVTNGMDNMVETTRHDGTRYVWRNLLHRRERGRHQQLVDDVGDD